MVDQLRGRTAMATRIKIAFACYLFVASASIVSGVRYMLASQIMPYHQEAVSVSWGELSPSIQTMFLVFLHASGMSMLLFATSVLILLLIPFRRGEVWSRWALPLLCVPAQIGALYFALDLHVSTQASTPWPDIAFTTILVLAAMALSIGRSRPGHVALIVCILMM